MAGDGIEDQEPHGHGEPADDTDIGSLGHDRMGVVEHGNLPIASRVMSRLRHRPHWGTAVQSASVTAARYLRDPPPGCGGAFTSAPKGASSKVPRSPGCLLQRNIPIEATPRILPPAADTQGNR